MPVEIIRRDGGVIIEGAVLSSNDFSTRIMRAGDRRVVTIDTETIVSRVAAGWHMMI